MTLPNRCYILQMAGSRNWYGGMKYKWNPTIAKPITKDEVEVVMATIYKNRKQDVVIYKLSIVEAWEDKHGSTQ